MDERKNSNGNGDSAGGGEAKASTSTTSSSSPPSSSHSPISSLEALLADTQGSELFEEYLDSEGLLQQLHFLFAIDGLKSTASNNDPPQKLGQKIRSISKLMDRLVGLSSATRNQICNDQISLPPNINIFDKARDEVELHMKINLLPNFLKSDIYLSNYIKLQTIIEESATGGGGRSGGISAMAGEGEIETSPPSGTVEFESNRSSKEGGATSLPLKIPSSSSSTTAHSSSSSVIPSAQLKLTSGALAATRKYRLDGSAPSTRLLVHHHPRKPSNTGSVLNPYHASYSSYNPVSRQDSEIQSLSSADGKIASSSGYLRKLQERRGGAKAELPNDGLPKLMKAVPEEAKPGVGIRPPQAFNQEEFTKELMQKLQDLVEERKKLQILAEEKKEEKLRGAIRPKEIASALRKIQCGGHIEAPEEILDQHLAIAFPDKTPPIQSPPRFTLGQKIKKSNGGNRSKKIDTYSLDSGIEFKTPGYEINPLKKPTVSKPKPGTSTTQEDSGISLVSSSTFTHAQHRVADWQSSLPTKSSSMHHGFHHHQQQQPSFPSSTSTSASLSAAACPPKKSATTTPPRYTIFVLYSDGPESSNSNKNSEPYRLTSDTIPTLGQLKEKLPRRGNYRYFLKKESTEVNMIVHEEITRDDEYLPSVNGKIIVTLQPQPNPLL